MTTVNCGDSIARSSVYAHHRRLRETYVEKPVVDRRDGVGGRTGLERVDFGRVEPRELQPRETEECEVQEDADYGAVDSVRVLAGLCGGRSGVSGHAGELSGGRRTMRHACGRATSQ